MRFIQVIFICIFSCFIHDSQRSPSLLQDFVTKTTCSIRGSWETLGGATEISRLTKERGIANEVLSTLFHQPRLTYCVFGSFYEGSLIPGVESDINNVFVVNGISVITVSCRSFPSGKCLLMVQDENTPAGYAKLQLVQNGKPLFSTDAAETSSHFFPAEGAFSASVDIFGRLVCSFSPSNHSDLGLQRHGRRCQQQNTRSSQLVTGYLLSSLRCYQTVRQNGL